MERQGDEVHFETDEARGASSPNIVRWILLISLFGAIILLSIIWITGAATQGDDEDEVSYTSKVADPPGRDTEGTDSIVGEDADELETVEASDEAPVGAAEEGTEGRGGATDGN